MRHRVLLGLLTVIAVFAFLVATGRIRYGIRDAAVASRDSLADSVGAADSVERAARRAADTMCFAARIGLPCDPP